MQKRFSFSPFKYLSIADFPIVIFVAVPLQTDAKTFLGCVQL
jgi:hypothetical protein